MKKVIKALSRTLLLSALITFAFVYNVQTTKAVGEVEISVVSSLASVLPGESFTVDIVINNPGTYTILSAQTDFEYDKDLVQVDSVSLGGFLGSAGAGWSTAECSTPYSGFCYTIDNAIGKITAMSGMRADIIPFETNTDLIFATINMTAKVAVSGSSYLRLPHTNISDPLDPIIITDDSYAQTPYVVTDSSIVVGDSAPTITSVSSSKSNGSYKAGEVIDIDVTFSEAVTSTGNVTVTLETGDPDRACTFTVTNSMTGTCDYTVQAGDTSSDLSATISGTIADQAANPLTNYTPTTTLATSKALVIDTSVPNAVNNLSASVINASSVNLIWNAPGDDASTGTATSYDIRYSTSTITEVNWASATAVIGEPDPQVAGTADTMTVNGLDFLNDMKYYFAIKTSDEALNTSALSNIPDTVSDNADLNIGDGSAVAGATDIVAIDLTGMNNFGVIDLSLSYNPDVINITDASLGFGGFGGDLTPNINNVSGISTFLIATSAIPGPNSPLTILNITLQSVGTKGQTSNLDIIVNTLSDTFGNAVTPTINNGVFTILNTAPVMNAVSITPNPAYKSTAELTANPSATDADSGDTISYIYQWKKGGIDIVGQIGSTLSNSNYAKGDAITVSVTPNDGTVNGNPISSSTLTISNSLPTEPIVAVFYPPGTYVNSEINAVAGASTDADSDEITYNYQWYVNGEAIEEDLIDGRDGSFLLPGKFVKGDFINVTVTPNDGTDDGASSSPAGFYVLNSLPSQPTVSVTNPAYDATDIVCSASGSTDADSDSIVYSYAWYKDNVLQGSLTTNTVNASNTSVGDAWKCIVTPSDGTVSGSAGEDTVTILADIDVTAPTITSVSSSKANGSYKAGEVIDIDVTFSEAVTSTGNVTVTLETGDPDRACTFTVTNSMTGTCDYTVQAGDTSSDLNATISGTIADQATNPLTNYVPATTLATNKALVIDTTAPATSDPAISSPTSSSLTLTWTAPGDDASNGTAASYDIRYSTSTITDDNWANATTISDEPVPQISGTSQSKTVSGLSSSTTYYFAIKTTDDAGNISAISNIASGTTSTASSGGGGGGGGGGGSPTSSVTNMSISINSRNATTNIAAVTLTIGATNATKMAISNTSDFSTGTWETYATTKLWNLEAGEGVKTVYIKFQDSSGYYSTPVSDTITFSASVTPAPIVSKYFDGTLLRAAIGDKVYVIKDGKKEWIRTAAEFVAGGYKWEDIKLITYAEIDAIADYSSGSVNPAPTPVLRNKYYADGSLIKTSDSFRVYVIMNQKKKWIATPEVFETLGYKWGNIAVITKNELDKITDFEDNLIRANGDYKVYLVVNGLRHHIPNPEVFLDYGFGWTDVKDVAPEIVNKYPVARLIRETGQSRIYYLSANAVKKWIPTTEIFNSYGNKTSDIQVISKKEMRLYAESNLMKLAGSDNIYVISGNGKRLIPNDAVFRKYKYDRSVILEANQNEFDYYKTGKTLY